MFDLNELKKSAFAWRRWADAISFNYIPRSTQWKEKYQKEWNELLMDKAVSDRKFADKADRIISKIEGNNQND